MTIDEAMALAETRGFNRSTFEFCVENLKAASLLSVEFPYWDDAVTVEHWSNFLTEDEMESIH